MGKMPERGAGAEAIPLDGDDIVVGKIPVRGVGLRVGLRGFGTLLVMSPKKARGLAERFIRRALKVSTHQVAALLPLKWLGSEGRVRMFTSEETAPIGVYVLSERPSMPPGDEIEALGDKAFERGKVDYIWILWDKRRHPQRDPSGQIFVPTYWIPPRDLKGTKPEQLSLAA